MSASQFSYEVLKKRTLVKILSKFCPLHYQKLGSVIEAFAGFTWMELAFIFW